MNSPKQRINLELLLGISATFLSLAALVVSIFQTKIAREQQQASVWPNVVYTNSYLDGKYTMSIENNGVGPAIIKKIDAQFGNQHYNHPKYVIKLATNGSGDDYTVYNVGRGWVLKSGDKVNLIESGSPQQAGTFLNLFDQNDSFNLSIYYSDIYGKCWMTGKKNSEPVDVNDCPK